MRATQALWRAPSGQLAAIQGAFSNRTFTIAPAEHQQSCRSDAVIGTYRDFVSGWLARDGAQTVRLFELDRATCLPKSYPRFFTERVSVTGDIMPAVEGMERGLFGISQCDSLVYTQNGTATCGFLDHCIQTTKDRQLIAAYTNEAAKQQQHLCYDELQAAADRLQHVRDNQDTD
jgi:hypothetical protein